MLFREKKERKKKKREEKKRKEKRKRKMKTCEKTGVITILQNVKKKKKRSARHGVSVAPVLL